MLAGVTNMALLPAPAIAMQPAGMIGVYSLHPCFHACTEFFAPTAGLFRRVCDFAQTIQPQHIAVAVSLIYLFAGQDPANPIDHLINSGLMMAGAKQIKTRPANTQEIKASIKINDHRGRLVRITEKGVEINGTVTLFCEFVAKGKKSMKEWIKEGEDAVARFQRMLEDIERHGTYEESLKFMLLINNGDITAANYFTKLMAWQAKELIGQVNSHYSRVFIDAPPLPVENGFWTEFVTAYKKFNDGASNAYGMCDMILFFISSESVDVKYSENSIRFGPVTLTESDAFKLFSRSVDETLEWCKKNRRFAPHRIKETIENLEPINMRGRRWLDRSDIPEELKRKLAFTYFFARSESGNEVGCLFIDDAFMNKSAEEAKVIIDTLYDKCVSPKLKGAKKVENTPPFAPKETPTNWQEVHPSWFTKLSDKYDHDKSYTVFKRVEFFKDMLKLGMSALKRNVAEDEMSPELLQFRAEAEEMVKFIRDPSISAMLRAIAVDLLIQVVDRQTLAVKQIHKIISKNKGRQVALELHRLYRDTVPYADALFAKLEEEKKANDAPLARAEKLLRNMGGEPDAVQSAWRSIQGRCPSSLHEAMREIFKTAVAEVGAKPEIYRPWILQGLGRLSHVEKDWAWVSAEYESPYEVVRYLQDMAYPIGGDALITRPQIDFSRLEFVHEDETWQRFAASTAFLTPYEWKNLIDTLANIHADTRNAIRDFRSRHPKTELPDFLSERAHVLSAENFNKEIESLSELLRQDAHAKFLRRLFRMAQNDKHLLFSLLRLASYGAKGRLNALRIIHILLEKQVAGDVIDTATRIALARTSMEEQAAKAEYTAIIKYADAGYKVRILTPDISMQKQTPDLLIESAEGEVTPVEIKSRLLPVADFSEIQAAIIDAANQLVAKIRRTPNAEKGMIELYLIENNGGETADLKGPIVKLLNDPTLNAPFDKVSGVNVHFVDDRWNEKLFFPVEN